MANKEPKKQISDLNKEVSKLDRTVSDLADNVSNLNKEVAKSLNKAKDGAKEASDWIGETSAGLDNIIRQSKEYQEIERATHGINLKNLKYIKEYEVASKKKISIDVKGLKRIKKEYQKDNLFNPNSYTTSPFYKGFSAFGNKMKGDLLRGEGAISNFITGGESFFGGSKGLDEVADWATTGREKFLKKQGDQMDNAYQVKRDSEEARKKLKEEKDAQDALLNKKIAAEQAKYDASSGRSKGGYAAQLKALQLKKVRSDNEYEKNLKKIREAEATAEEANRQKVRANFTSYVLEGVESLLKDIGKKVATAIQQTAKDALKMLSEAATYDVANSYIMNSDARNQMLRYGLSSKQSYAFSKTSGMMGIKSEEDLFWMNDNQREMFQSLMQKEMSIYDTMRQNGTLEGFQKMQIDFQILKQEFLANVVSFLVKNKDTIMTTLRVGLGLLETIANGVLKVLSIFGKASSSNILDSGYSTDTISNSTTNNNRTNNVSLNYNIPMQTYSPVNREELANQISQSTMTSLSSFFNS